ncbi:NAD(P)/FAD-dependent oxidoreductase [Seleniivibrio woodruffii]|uniref:NAD(P)/FAD-dependent oxidoreductase n=1 Tax=Seleniivibrio woodruffii TaxID=1078050 RepID=UPI002409DF57|nr:NAD(P)/FAD-dependent oxidoreductase [Seleniivibrio woodruffii]
MSISRRDFVKYTAAAAAGTAVFGNSGEVFAAKTTGIVMPKKGKRIVVLGGGWGGCTAAKYARLEDPSVEVILVEKEPTFISCPISNFVIVGKKRMQDITFTRDKLTKNYGVKIVYAEAKGLDAVKKTLATTAGTIEYDKLIVAPGISYDYDKIEGLNNPAAIKRFPAAFKAGAETIALKNQLEAMKPGGVVLLSVPPAPYRCPPGPYERASMIANYLKQNKKGSKIIVADANDDVTSKGPLFKKAWADMYQGVLEYVPDSAVLKVDASTGVITTEQGEIKADVANIIPPMKAGQIAFDLGLMNKTDDMFVRADAFTLETYNFKDVYVVGDAAHNGTVGGVPKSGYIANSMGKYCASAAVRTLNGQEPLAPSLINTCYSAVSDDEAIFVAAVYKYDPVSKRLISASSATSPERRKLFEKHAEDWAVGIWSDILS